MRRYELDWLRVIAFGLLILYHVGMFFVPWSWHIKNNETSTGMTWPMIFVNQWRLPLLFVISGMGTAFSLSKRSGREFMGERFTRLIIPLIFGMLLIVPPQVYLERVAGNGYEQSFLYFMLNDAYSGIYPQGNLSWHHLWFLPYLLLFSLLLLPLFLKLRKSPLASIKKLVSRPWGIFTLILPLFLWEVLLRPRFPSTHALIGDWFNIVYYLTLFFYGFLLVKVSDGFWENVRRHYPWYLILGTITFSTLLLLRYYPDSTMLFFFRAGIRVINLWCWILGLFGIASVWLSRPGRFINYATKAVYPYYILHQTVTVIIGFYIMNMPWSIVTKFIILTAGTFGICFLAYELIRRSRVLGILFGNEGLWVRKKKEVGLGV
jgi:glucans biosynthesis protein C